MMLCGRCVYVCVCVYCEYGWVHGWMDTIGRQMLDVKPDDVVWKVCVCMYVCMFVCVL